MSKLILLIVLAIFISAQNVRLSDKPFKKDGVKLTVLGTMQDEEEGFYQTIDTSVSEDGKVAILDRGNKLIHVYTKTGTPIVTFGKEGTGPGELTNAGRIFAFNDRVLIQNFDRIMMFDYTGKLINEIKERTNGASIYKTSGGFKYVFDGKGRPNPILSKEFDLDGKKIEEVMDPNFAERSKLMPKSPEDFMKRMPQLMKLMFEAPTDLTQYGDGYIRHYQGEYRFEKLDKNMNVTATITRPFMRVKDSNNQLETARKRMQSRNVPEAQMKQQLAMMQARITEMAKHNKGFKNDIQEIVGSYKGYVFLSVASSKDTNLANGVMTDGGARDMQIDVISPDNKLYTTIDIATLDIENMEDLNWITIIENKMVFEMQNDEDGPYVKLINIEINEPSIIAGN